MASVNFGADVYVDGELEIEDDLTVGGQIESLVDLIAPFVVTSTVLNENLNADLLDGEHGAYYLDLVNATGVLGVAHGGTGLSTVGSAGQLLRSTGTGLEYFTHDFISSTLLGAVNGVATLDATGKVPLVQLPSMGMQYKGTWDASTNTPTLADGVGSEGDLYRVIVSGTVDFGSGNISFTVGDDVIYNGSVWERAPAGHITPTLQQVTDQGAVTSNDITIEKAGSASSILVGESISGSYSFMTAAPNVAQIGSTDGTLAASFLVSPSGAGLTFVNFDTADVWSLQYISDGVASLDSGHQLRVQQDPVHNNDLARKLYVDTGLSAKFDIPTGTTSQYIRGDGSLDTFPTIPTVGNGVLTMSVGTGLTGSATFSANQSGNSTFTVGLGTNLSNLNALSTSGFVKKTGANTWSIDTTTYMAASNAYTKTESDGAYVKKAGDTMTGTLNGTRIILNDQFEVTKSTSPNHKIHLIATDDYTRLNMGYGGHTTFQIHVVENGTSYFVHNIGDGYEQRMMWDNSKNITFNVANRIQVNGDVRYTGQLVSTVATGTAPMSITSTTQVNNLNADLLDGQHGSYYLSLANATGVLPVAKGGTGLNTIGTAGQMLRSTGSALEFFTPTFLTSVALGDLTNVTLSSPANGQVLTYNGSAWVNSTLPSIPTNYVTTDTNQSSLGGTKDWTSAHSWTLSSNAVPAGAAGRIAIGKVTSGVYIQAYDNDANEAFALRTFAASGGYQLTLNKGGVETSTHGNSSQWNSTYTWVNTYGSGLQSGPYVKLTGDTMSGSLSISGDGNGLYLHQGAAVYKRVGGGLTLKRHNDAAEVSIENAAGDQRYPIWSDAYSMWRGGTTPYSSGDLSDIGLVGGAYYAHEAASDKPGGVNSYILHIPHHSDSSYWMQIGSPYLHGSKLYIRKHLPSGTESWIPIAYESWVSSNFVSSSAVVSAGNGLTGGGVVSTNPTITLGTPGNITLSSSNSVSTNSHTHAFVPGGNTSQYIRGDGTLATFPVIPTVNNGTLTLSTSGSGLSGSASFSANQSGNSTFTVSVASGYTIPNNDQVSHWEQAYGWGNHASAGYVQTSRQVNTSGSLQGGGNLGSNRTLQLVNDNGAPGNNKYYGTNNAGVKGFYDLPSGGGGGVSGSGTTGYIPLWTSGSTISNSVLQQSGTNLSISGTFTAGGLLANSIIQTPALEVLTYIRLGAYAGPSSPSAILDVSSTSKGFLMPRMNNTQITSISSPAEGLMVYSTDEKAPCWFDGNSWWVLYGQYTL